MGMSEPSDTHDGMTCMAWDVCSVRCDNRNEGIALSRSGRADDARSFAG